MDPSEARSIGQVGILVVANGCKRVANFLENAVSANFGEFTFHAPLLPTNPPTISAAASLLSAWRQRHAARCQRERAVMAFGFKVRRATRLSAPCAFAEGSLTLSST